jgi:hypothetical protein
VMNHMDHLFPLHDQVSAKVPQLRSPRVLTTLKPRRAARRRSRFSLFFSVMVMVIAASPPLEQG